MNYLYSFLFHNFNLHKCVLMLGALIKLTIVSLKIAHFTKSCPLLFVTQGVVPTFPCKISMSGRAFLLPQILSPSFDVPQILNLKLLRPKILSHVLEYHCLTMCIRIWLYKFWITFWSLSDVSYSDECQTKKAFQYVKKCCRFFVLY